MQKGLVAILMAYNRNDQEFHMGGHRLTMHPNEFNIIFGVPSDNKEIDMTPSPIAESDFGRRKFPRKLKVIAPDLLEELQACAEGPHNKTLKIQSG